MAAILVVDLRISAVREITPRNSGLPRSDQNLRWLASVRLTIDVVASLATLLI